MSGFETTHWSIVRAAGSESTGRSRDALAHLCSTYWEPLYGYLRRQGHSAEDAEDLTQGFFTRVLEKGVLRAADPQRGRFRAFLLASLRHYTANERAHAQAQKRGGATPALPLEFDVAEQRYLAEPHDAATPETIFDRRWALTVLSRTLATLGAESRRRGKGQVFDALKDHLVAPEGRPFVSRRRAPARHVGSRDAGRRAPLATPVWRAAAPRGRRDREHSRGRRGRDPSPDSGGRSRVTRRVPRVNPWRL